MAQSGVTRNLIRFGPFAADLRTRELFRGGIRIKLQDRPFDILVMLLQQPGEIVTREEMRERLWPDGTFVDFDNNISSAIGKLRAALSDSAAAPRYIETMGRGYRFVGQVVSDELVANRSAPLVSDVTRPAPSDAPSAQSPRNALRRKWLWVWSAVVLAVITTAGSYTEWSLKKTSHARTRVMLAVLPFENLIGDSSQDYFSDGMTQEMITQLGELDPKYLGVIARTSVMRYKHSQTPLSQIGRELGVQYVLEGSVRRQGDQLRVNAQLIDVHDQTHLWAREYEREQRELLAVQTEIAQQIALEIQRALGTTTPQTKTTIRPSMSTSELSAYDLFLQGQYFMAKRSARDLLQARELFQESIAKNPRFARSWAALANTYTLIGGYTGVSASGYPEKAREAALRALAIDERLPEAHAALALIVQNYDWDWQTAEKEFRRAIELNPNDVTAHHWYAEHLMWRGRFDQALKESEQARQLDPLSLIVAADNGVIYYYDKQYDVAIQRFREVQAFDPTFARASMIYYAYTQKGMFTEALSFISITPSDNPWHWSDMAFINGRAGRIREAHEALQRLGALYGAKDIDPAVFVRPYIALGEKEEAIAALQKAFAAHSDAIVMLKVDPAFDPIRGDARFQELVRKAGLSE